MTFEKNVPLNGCLSEKKKHFIKCKEKLFFEKKCHRIEIKGTFSILLLNCFKIAFDISGLLGLVLVQMVKLWFVLEESLIKKLTKNQKKAVEPLGLWHHLRSLMLSQYPPKIQFLENSHPSWPLSEFFRSIQVPDLVFQMAITLKLCIYIWGNIKLCRVFHLKNDKSKRL